MKSFFEKQFLQVSSIIKKIKTKGIRNPLCVN